MTFSPTDFVLCAGILLFAISWSVRGFIRQGIGLLTLALSVWVAWQYEAQLAAELIPWVGSSLALRRMVAFILLLLSVALCGLALAQLIGKLVHWLGIGNLDRLLGLITGVFLGGAICWAVLFGVRAVAPQLAEQRWWQESQLIPVIFDVAGRLRGHLPGWRGNGVRSSVLDFVPMLPDTTPGASDTADTVTATPPPPDAGR